jgi:hypothetical protein
LKRRFALTPGPSGWAGGELLVAGTTLSRRRRVLVAGDRLSGSGELPGCGGARGRRGKAAAVVADFEVEVVRGGLQGDADGGGVGVAGDVAEGFLNDAEEGGGGGGDEGGGPRGWR